MYAINLHKSSDDLQFVRAKVAKIIMDDYLGRDSRIFREKYDVEKLIMKSANGILYQGEIKFL